MNGPPPRSTLVPCTPLFRADPPVRGEGVREGRVHHLPRFQGFNRRLGEGPTGPKNPLRRVPGQVFKRRKILRSEEHTSELQSRQYLVCRLLLEKKKTPISRN